MKSKYTYITLHGVVVLDIVHDAFGMPMTKQYKDKLQEDKKVMLRFQKKILVNMLVIIYF